MPNHVAILEFVFGFSWPDTRTTSASHLGNKNALWATHCSYAATWQISVHAPDHTDNLRPQLFRPTREGNNNYSTSMQQQSQYFNGGPVAAHISGARMFSHIAGVCGMSHWGFCPNGTLCYIRTAMYGATNVRSETNV